MVCHYGFAMTTDIIVNFVLYSVSRCCLCMTQGHADDDEVHMPEGLTLPL